MRNGWCKSPPERAPATIAQRQGCSNGGAWALGTDWRRRRARSSVPSYTGRSAGFQMRRTLRLRGTTCTLCADYFCRSFLSATFIASAVVTFDLRPWGEFGWGLPATSNERSGGGLLPESCAWASKHRRNFPIRRWWCRRRCNDGIAIFTELRRLIFPTEDCCANAPSPERF